MMFLRGCGMFEMCDVRDVECWGCEMFFGMWNVWDEGSLGWECLGCRMFVMWDVLVMRRRIFTGMRDAGLKMSFANRIRSIETF